MERFTSVCLAVCALLLVDGWNAIASDVLANWRNHNSFQNEETLLRDWSCQGKFRVEAKGLHLIGDSRMTSNFKLADGSRLLIGCVANNRNFYIDVCGESIEIRAADKHGSEAYGIAIERHGRTLTYGKWVNGKMTEPNKILISKEKAARPSNVSFTSRRVHIPLARSDRFDDVQVRLLTVSGKVVEANGN